MPQQVKSLLECCQNSLTKSGCFGRGWLCTILSFKRFFKHATPQQLYRIERANPDLALESPELWLKHCLAFRDIRIDFEQGLYRDPREWRKLYLNRHKENERKRLEIKERVANHYSKIKNEKAARSIKVLHGIVPTTKRRTYEAARQSTMSKLFQQTKKEADKAASIYQQPKRSTAAPSLYGSSQSSTNVISAPKPPSRLVRAYQSNQAKYPRPASSPPSSSLFIAPKSRVLPTSTSKEKVVKKPKLSRNDTDYKPNQNERTVEVTAVEEKKLRPAAIVNFNIFNELSYLFQAPDCYMKRMHVRVTLICNPMLSAW
ncbi:unnamed protein product [Mucor hiemalis]